MLINGTDLGASSSIASTDSFPSFRPPIPEYADWFVLDAKLSDGVIGNEPRLLGIAFCLMSPASNVAVDFCLLREGIAPVFVRFLDVGDERSDDSAGVEER